MNSKVNPTGPDIYKWACDLFPINRSITGPGVRQTLKYIKNLFPELSIHEVPSGTVVFDWTVPDEWAIESAYIENEKRERIVDFDNSNLHIVAYSEPVDEWLEFEELDKHLYSLPDQPDAIPYITSFYKRNWGFCLTHNQRLSLDRKSRYHVVINSKLEKGSLTYGELIIPGKSEKEVLLSTYICHPSLGNNEISGIVVTMGLAYWINGLLDREYTYRILFVPETIGAIAYLSKNSKEMKDKTIAGFVVTCVGDNRAYSFMPSRTGKTLADKIARFTMENYLPKFDEYSFLERGSDERQYCSPLIDLPVVSVMRSKYGTYPEYHTSLDNLDLICPEGLGGAFDIISKCIEILEINQTYIVTNPCEPQLGKRGLYKLNSNLKGGDTINNLLAYLDGKTDLVDISRIIGADIFDCNETILILLKFSLVKRVLNINK
jgi:aminopeptidase-like protein